MKRVKRILVIRLSSLGDIVLTEPVIRVLKKQYPDAVIDYLIKPQFSEIAASIRGVDRIVSWSNTAQVLKDISANRYDLIVDLHAKLKSKMIKYFAVAISYLKYRDFSAVAVSYKKSHLKRRLIIWKISKESILSTVYSYLSVLKKLGITCELQDDDLEPILGIPKISPFPELGLLRELRAQGKTLTAIFPGATYYTKQFPAEKFAEFIDSQSSPEQIFFVMGSKSESTLSKRVVALCESKPYDWTGLFSLANLLSVMAMMDVVMTNDSGPMHIAAALSKKQIAIFGSTHPRLGFKPLNHKAIIVQNNKLACRPCSLHGKKKCPRNHFSCMQEITISQLAESYKSLL
jgi:heptosyltransferase II